MPAGIPPEYKSQTPKLLRHYVQKCSGQLPVEFQRLLLDTANEIEGSEEAFACLVDQKRELQQKLTHTESLLRSAYDMLAGKAKESTRRKAQC